MATFQHLKEQKLLNRSKAKLKYNWLHRRDHQVGQSSFRSAGDRGSPYGWSCGLAAFFFPVVCSASAQTTQGCAFGGSYRYISSHERVIPHQKSLIFGTSKLDTFEFVDDVKLAKLLLILRPVGCSWRHANWSNDRDKIWWTLTQRKRKIWCWAQFCWTHRH
jgi:hypothetical protein